jgi:wyosine [tRNA(Phe)-imidazoG37] synthetase (radical SAM superfamily)
MEREYRIIYGPVPSWRLGASLGIDLLSREEKICSFDCVYCQLGRTDLLTTDRGLYVTTEEVLEEIAALPPDVGIDTLTFSGRGEPMLAANLGGAIEAVKLLRREPVAVLTNSSLIGRRDVRSEIAQADIVVAKLDACSNELLRKINRPAAGVAFEEILDGLIAFRRQYRGRLAIQIMFVEANREAAGELARLACRIGADEVQINTPLRPGGSRPLDRLEIQGIAKCFRDLPVRCVYEEPRREAAPIRGGDALRRRGKG